MDWPSLMGGKDSFLAASNAHVGVGGLPDLTSVTSAPLCYYPTLVAHLYSRLTNPVKLPPHGVLAVGGVPRAARGPRVQVTHAVLAACGFP